MTVRLDKGFIRNGIINKKLNLVYAGFNMYIALPLKAFELCIGKASKSHHADLSLSSSGRLTVSTSFIGKEVLTCRDVTEMCLVTALLYECIFC